MFSRSPFYLSSKAKSTLHYSLIYPHITQVSYLNKIYCSQKKRSASYYQFRLQSVLYSLFSRLGIFDIYHIHTFQIAKLMYCYHNSNLLPQIHGYSTRTANNYRVHHCRTNLKKFTILYQGPKTRNSLPVTITSLSNFPKFKNKLLEVLVKQFLNWQSRTLQHYLCNRIVTCEVASTIKKPSGFQRSRRLTLNIYKYSLHYVKRQINRMKKTVTKFHLLSKHNPQKLYQFFKTLISKKCTNTLILDSKGYLSK